MYTTDTWHQHAIFVFCIVFYSKTGSENSVCLVFLQFRCASDPGTRVGYTLK